jgi:hypothetical protein
MACNDFSLEMEVVLYGCATENRIDSFSQSGFAVAARCFSLLSRCYLAASVGKSRGLLRADGLSPAVF